MVLRDIHPHVFFIQNRAGTKLTWASSFFSCWILIDDVFTALYGFPIDSRTSYTSSRMQSAHYLIFVIPVKLIFLSLEWMIWAGMTASTSVQNDFINAIHSWLSSGLTSTPFGDRFEDNTGANSANEARPVVGGYFSSLLVFLQNLTTLCVAPSFVGDCSQYYWFEILATDKSGLFRLERTSW